MYRKREQNLFREAAHGKGMKFLVKIKWKLCLLVLTTVLLLTGCSLNRTEENGYTVYCVNATGTRLIENSYKPAAETFDEILDELIGQLRTAPSGYVSVLQDGITFNGYERGIDALRVDFSKEYYNLSNTEEVLLRAAIVKTVCQIPGVTKVMITINGEQLRDSEGELVPAMDANTFIDTKEGGINSYQYATLLLYFADKTGNQMEQETRNLHYSSNMVLERVVVEQLIKGPETSGLKAILSSDVRIQNIYTQNGVCTITFSEEAEKNPSESALNAETALYAIVNSICATCDNISGVKFEINGDTDGRFRGDVELNQIFMPNDNLVVKEEIQTEAHLTSEEKEVSSVAEQTETEAAAEQAAGSAETDGTAAGEVIEGKSIAGVDPTLTEE